MSSEESEMFRDIEEQLKLLEDSINHDRAEKAGELMQEIVSLALAAKTRWALDIPRTLHDEVAYWTVLHVAKDAVKSKKRGSKKLVKLVNASDPEAARQRALESVISLRARLKHQLG